MFCIYCQRPTPDDATFCPGCGKPFQKGRPLPLTCASCRASNPGDAIFCWSCGRRLEKEENAADFILPVPPLPQGAQPAAGNVPVVHGIPQAGGVPVVHGIPSPLDASSLAHATGQSPSPAAPSEPGAASTSLSSKTESPASSLAPSQAPSQEAGSSASAATVSAASASSASQGTQSAPFRDPAPHPPQQAAPLPASPSPPSTPIKPRSPIGAPVIILGTILIVVILIGAVLVNVLHLPLPGSGGTPGVVPKSTTCSGSTCTGSPSVSKPGVVPTSLSISGGVTGNWKVNAAGARCLTKQDQSFNWGALGLFNGQEYGFLFGVPSAHAGSYAPVYAIFENQDTKFLFKDGTSDYWGKQAKGTFTMSVASDGAISGTVDVVIQGVDVISNVPGTTGTPFPAPANSVHVTGNWTCNVYH